MEEFLLSLCKRLTDFFFKGFGNYKDTQGNDIVIPADANWHIICSLNTPCKLYIRNMSAADEIQITWNKDNSIGAKMMKDSFLILDDMIGIVYAKMVDPTKTTTVNYLAVPVKINE